tara:strand:- start:122 stop:295 length:174 start_codon:yes stop_codon:yes gene_type:complete
MELVGLLALALIVGLFLRKRGDNTMDTLSKGCGCLVLLVVILFLVYVFIGFSIFMPE